MLTVSNFIYPYFAFSLAAGVEPPSSLYTDMETRVLQVLDLEKELVKLLPNATWAWEALRTESITVRELQALCPALSWQLVLGKGPDHQVRVYGKPFFQSLNSLIARSDVNAVKAYMWYSVVVGHSWRFAARAMREMFLGYLPGLKVDYAAADCAQLTYDVAHEAALQTLLHARSETFLLELGFAERATQDAVTSLTATLDGLTWVSAQTRGAIGQRLSALSTLSPDLSPKETMVPGSIPNVNPNYSLVTNAVNTLRSLAKREAGTEDTTVSRPADTRFQFSPVYSPVSGDLYLPPAFLHLGSWLQEHGELRPLADLLLARALLHGLMRPPTRAAWSDGTWRALGARETCLRDNVVSFPAAVDADQSLHLLTAAAALQLVNKNTTAGQAEALVLGAQTFADHQKFRFYLLAQAYCSGDVYSRYGEIFPGRPKPEAELNFAITSDMLFFPSFVCEPGLPMSGSLSCPIWDNSFTSN